MQAYKLIQEEIENEKDENKLKAIWKSFDAKLKIANDILNKGVAEKTVLVEENISLEPK